MHLDMSDHLDVSMCRHNPLAYWPVLQPIDFTKFRWKLLGCRTSFGGPVVLACLQVIILNCKIHLLYSYICVYGFCFTKQLFFSLYMSLLSEKWMFGNPKIFSASPGMAQSHYSKHQALSTVRGHFSVVCIIVEYKKVNQKQYQNSLVMG